MSNVISSSQFCIAIASHISNVSRIPFLIETIESLINQSVQISIYLSISFSNDDIREQTLHTIANLTINSPTNLLNIRVRDEKTPQMRHFLLLLPEVAANHQWIMFCDDDDTYIPSRVEQIYNTICAVYEEVHDMNNKNGDDAIHLAGLYENVNSITHYTKRHEYWCYCVQVTLFEQFLDLVNPIPEIINDQCCDVLFGEYLRRKSTNWLYIQVPQPMYNYRVENNSDSVTGFIQTSQYKYTNQSSPPPLGDDTWLDYVLEWNEFLHANIHIFLHDTYLRALVGCDLDAILRSEFKDNYAILDYVDQVHIRRITDLYTKMRGVCDEIYDNKL